MISFSDGKAALDALTAAAKRIQNREVIEQVLSVHGFLLDVYGQLVNERDARERSDARIKELEAKLDERALLVSEGNLLWKNTGDGNRIGPYCTRCHAILDKLVPLRISEMQLPTCPECKNWYPA